MKKVLAFDIGGTNTRLALVNENFEIEKVQIYPTSTGDVEKFMENVLKLLDEFSLDDVVAIGAGVPGVVNKETSTIIDLPNVGIKNVEFGKILKEKTGLPVFLRNDAELACLSEAYLGAGKDYERVFFITISTGIGGALCVDKQIQDYPFEVGHTLFKYKDSFQEYEIASGKNIHKLAALNNINIKLAREMFEKVRLGDKDALILYDEWKKIVGAFIKLMINSYAPDIIVITGGFMKNKDLFLDYFKKENPDTLIEECKFSEQAGLIGSAVYAFQKLGKISN